MQLRDLKLFLFLAGILASISFPNPSSLFAEEETRTTRVPQLETDEVEVWKTTIYPKQPLKMHRHEHRRIVVALTDTKLKVKNDKGESHVMDWKKGTAHLLEADKPGELHMDLNESDKPMEVMVIQFKVK